jgi:CcmD family protein
MNPAASNWEFVAAAYGVAWAVILGYLLYLRGRLRSARAAARGVS